MLNVPVSEIALIADIGWDSFIVVGVIIVMGFGVIYGLKTRKGSGINEHPGPDSGDPVASDQSVPAETGEESPGAEEDKDSTLGQRGTK